MSAPYPPPPPAGPAKRKLSTPVIVAIVVGVAIVFFCGLFSIIGLIVGDEDDSNDAGGRGVMGPPVAVPPSSTPSTTTAPPAPDQGDNGDDRVFPGGQPLSHYKQLQQDGISDTYPWRVNLVDNLADLDAAIADIDFDDTMVEPDDSVYDHVISTCDDLNDETRQDATKTARLRWSSSLEPIAEEKAVDLVDLSITYACPKLG